MSSTAYQSSSSRPPRESSASRALPIAEFERATGQRFSGGLNVLVKVTVKYQAAYGLQLNLQDIDINFTLGTLEQ